MLYRVPGPQASCILPCIFNPNARNRPCLGQLRRFRSRVDFTDTQDWWFLRHKVRVDRHLLAPCSGSLALTIRVFSLILEHWRGADMRRAGSSRRSVVFMMP